MGKVEMQVKIAEDGSVTVAVRGAPGASCLEKSKFLEEAMGGGVSVREETQEMHQVAVDEIIQGEG